MYKIHHRGGSGGIKPFTSKFPVFFLMCYHRQLGAWASRFGINFQFQQSYCLVVLGDGPECHVTDNFIHQRGHAVLWWRQKCGKEGIQTFGFICDEKKVEKVDVVLNLYFNEIKCKFVWCNYKQILVFSP